VQSQLNNCLDKFYSQNEVDNVINVAEANQIPGGLKSLYETLTLKSTIAALKKTPNVFSVGKAFSKSLSTGFLAYSFGIAPLLSDMKTMGKRIKTMQSDLKASRNREGKEETVRTVVNGSISDSTGEIGPYCHAYCSQHSVPTRVVGVTGVRTQAYSSSTFSAINAAMTRLGGTGPASFLWEKIPYSFVVDWFVDLRSVCNGLDNLLTGSTKKVSTCWMSESWAAKVIGKLHGANSIIPAENSVLFETYLKYYSRKAIPATAKVTGSGRFGKKQFALLGALIHQKVAKR
jgi:hypothetical protein